MNANGGLRGLELHSYERVEFTVSDVVTAALCFIFILFVRR